MSHLNDRDTKLVGLDADLIVRINPAKSDDNCASAAGAAVAAATLNDFNPSLKVSTSNTVYNGLCLFTKLKLRLYGNTWVTEYNLGASVTSRN